MRQTARNASAHDTETRYNLGELHPRKTKKTATRQRRKVSRLFQRLPSRRILLKPARSSGQFSVQRTRVLQDGGIILEPGDEAAGLMRAVSWETLLTCCFTPHRLSSLWNGRAPRKLRACPPQASRPPQNAQATLPRMPIAATRKQPHAPANVHAPDSHHANDEPSRQERTRRRECEHQAETLHRSKQRAAPKDGSLQSSYGPAYAFDAW